VVRRIVEEDVATPTTTVVHEDDGSWIGRTIVALVILALVVAGGIWLVRSLSDSGGDVNINNNNRPPVEQQQNQDGNTNPDTDTDTDTNVEPSGVMPS
jgi:hypothetical protein